jgi:hypothetical protein
MPRRNPELVVDGRQREDALFWRLFGEDDAQPRAIGQRVAVRRVVHLEHDVRSGLDQLSLPGLENLCRLARCVAHQQRKRAGFTRTMTDLAMLLDDWRDVFRVGRDIRVRKRRGCAGDPRRARGNGRHRRDHHRKSPATRHHRLLVFSASRLSLPDDPVYGARGSLPRSDKPGGRPRDRRLYDRPTLAPRVTRSSSSCSSVSPIPSVLPEAMAPSRASFDG